MKLFIHSFGFRFHYRKKPGFDVFAFIDEAAAMGFSGVNLSAFPPEYRFLNGIDDKHIRAIRSRLEANGLEIDIETGGVDPEHIAFTVDLAGRLGARHVRTYSRPMPGGPREEIEEAVRSLAVAAPRAEAAGIRLLLENHEAMPATQVAAVLRRVDHPNLGALYDYGNSMLFMEEPLDSLEHMLPWVASGHLKDHVVVPAGATGNEEPIYLGVAIGEGNLPVTELTQRIVAAGADRVCFESCWAYHTHFRDRRGTAEMGVASFGYRHPPYDLPAYLMNVQPDDPDRGLDLPALERSALERSVRWLKESFEKSGIILDRPLQV